MAKRILANQLQTETRHAQSFLPDMKAHPRSFVVTTPTPAATSNNGPHPPSRVDWAVLLQRTFGFDALRCPKCDAKMRIISTIIDPDVAKKILAHLRMRTEPLPLARARDPAGQTDFDFDVA